jgi:hypothetical protein
LRFPEREDPRVRVGLDRPRPQVEDEYLRSLTPGLEDEYPVPLHPAIADRKEPHEQAA